VHHPAIFYPKLITSNVFQLFKSLECLQFGQILNSSLFIKYELSLHMDNYYLLPIEGRKDDVSAKI